MPREISYLPSNSNKHGILLWNARSCRHWSYQALKMLRSWTGTDPNFLVQLLLLSRTPASKSAETGAWHRKRSCPLHTQWNTRFQACKTHYSNTLKHTISTMQNTLFNTIKTPDFKHAKHTLLTRIEVCVRPGPRVVTIWHFFPRKQYQFPISG